MSAYRKFLRSSARKYGKDAIHEANAALLWDRNAATYDKCAALTSITDSERDLYRLRAQQRRDAADACTARAGRYAKQAVHLAARSEETA